MDSLVSQIVANAGEKKALSNVFSSAITVEVNNVGEEKEVIPGKIDVCVGAVRERKKAGRRGPWGSTRYTFRGREVLDEPEMTVDDDDSMVRFDAALGSYGVTFDELLEDFDGNFDGFMDVDDAASVLEGCVLGLLARKGMSGREAYVEVKGRMRQALLVPLAFEEFTVVFERGEIVEVSCDDIFIDNFEAVWYDEEIVNVGSGTDRDERKNRKYDGSLKAKLIICRLMKVPKEALRLLGGLTDVGYVLERMFDVINEGGGGFQKKKVNKFGKVRSKLGMGEKTETKLGTKLKTNTNMKRGTRTKQTVSRFTILREEDGCVRDALVTSEGMVESVVNLTNIEMLGRGAELDEADEEELHLERMREIKAMMKVEEEKLEKAREMKKALEVKEEAEAKRVREEYERRASPKKTILMKKGTLTEGDLVEKRMLLARLKAEQAENKKKDVGGVGAGAGGEGDQGVLSPVKLFKDDGDKENAEMETEMEMEIEKGKDAKKRGDRMKPLQNVN